MKNIALGSVIYALMILGMCVVSAQTNTNGLPPWPEYPYDSTTAGSYWFWVGLSVGILWGGVAFCVVFVKNIVKAGGYEK